MISSPVAPEFVTLRNALDQFWSEGFGGHRGPWTRPNGSTYAPVPLDVYATSDAVVILAAVPGMRSEDLEVTYTKGTILLSGTIGNVAESADAKGATWYVHELWHGRFQRAITPPFEVDADRAEATFEDGVLRIWLPKAEHAKPRRIEVKIAHGPAAAAIDAETTPVPETAPAAEPVLNGNGHKA